MYKKTIKFTDYDGVERVEDHYFNISKAEIIEMDAMTPGGFQAKIKRIIDSPNRDEVWQAFKELITLSIGRKSPDGRRFEKSEEITKEFMETEAYSVLLDEFITDASTAAEFVNSIFPKDMVAKATPAITPTASIT